MIFALPLRLQVKGLRESGDQICTAKSTVHLQKRNGNSDRFAEALEALTFQRYDNTIRALI